MPRKLLGMLAPATDGSRATVAQEVVLLLVSMPGRTLTAFGEIGCKIRLRKLLRKLVLLLLLSSKLLLLPLLLLLLGPSPTALLPLMVAVSAAAKLCRGQIKAYYKSDRALATARQHVESQKP
jgi:hypothetical protein